MTQVFEASRESHFEMPSMYNGDRFDAVRKMSANTRPESGMKRIPRELLLRMAGKVSHEDRDEMAIPSYLYGNPAMRWMAWRRVSVIARLLRATCKDRDADSRRTIMDFGCGTGVLLYEASRYAEQVYAIDIVLDPARLLVDEWQLEKVTLLNPEQAEEHIAENSIDTIIAAEVLEHIDPLDSTLAFFERRMKADGNLLISVPTESLLYRLGRRMAGFHGHYHQSNAAKIHRQIQNAGFKAVRTMKIPLPGPLAIYWVIDYRQR